VTDRLSRAFYARSTLQVARDLLGKRLVHCERSGHIVEVEAYIGPDDRASHARVGRRGRAAIMYGPAGYAYVYLVYGMHYCFNVVTERDDVAGAVLVRAIDVAGGNGPALVCRSLNIDRSCNGLDLTDSELYLVDGPPVADEDVRVGPRIGVDYAGEWAARPWRLWVANSQHVSRRRITGVALDRAMLG
jgi:DNA-3-methyladenine glycosylase